MMSAFALPVSGCSQVALVDRFQGVLIGAALAMEESQQAVMWWQSGQAIAQTLISGAVAVDSAASTPDRASRRMICGDTSWDQGLLALPLFLASGDLTSGDQLNQWQGYEARNAWVWDILGLDISAVDSSLRGDRHKQDADAQSLNPRVSRSLSSTAQVVEAPIWMLPYALVPITLVHILHSDLNAGYSHQTLLKSLAESLPIDDTNVVNQSMESLCQSLVQCVEQAVDSAQSLDVFLRSVRHQIDEAALGARSLLMDAGLEESVVFPRLATDGVLVSLLLYCLVATPAEYDMTLQRFRRALSSKEMNQFEDLQPYLKLSQPSAIATLGSLLGACGGQSNLPLCKFHAIMPSQFPNSPPHNQVFADSVYTDLMMWGGRLYAFWAGMIPSVCLQI